jgi:hypothetical protein
MIPAPTNNKSHDRSAGSRAAAAALARWYNAATDEARKAFVESQRIAVAAPADESDAAGKGEG